VQVSFLRNAVTILAVVQRNAMLANQIIQQPGTQPHQRQTFYGISFWGLVLLGALRH
jgi:hypothetical protein